MANTSTRGRGTGPGSPGRRTLNAAARAAAKRSGGGPRTRDPLADLPDDVVNDRTGLPEVEKVVGKVLSAPARGRETDEPSDSLEGSPDSLESPEPPAAGPDPEADRSPDPAEDRDAPPAARPRPRRARLTALLAVLTLAGLVTALVLGLEYREGRRVQEARTEALEAARTAAPVVLSYDHRRLGKDFAAAREHLTGDFREEYARTTKKVVGPTAKKYEGVVKASVVAPPDGGAPAASVVSATPDRAVVLLFVNQVTRSTQVSDSRVDLNRVRMTLTRTPQGWKVSAVDAL
ncbi:hypothetical protein [Streptomyces cavernicola]|uniref:Mce-associated membrane protein n=1 Tax=Streptomyces cavernicola TaxID=3043613 RepID=A0ABT6SAX1_9ACTN|nr:hypothetical protein [Streptomyces sp. B-S-A6]MDI3405346.1 hypothetical protein [Streptomyces sp. B-S-A6]